ncbi:MAG: type II toxin-antitoxin system VapB family antitoxin [Deltaproteobacteria bacterium]|nr:type II toxin-antitoxin system VapB family antitoxin [Deltaproteobacteria bacterium]
MKRTNLVLNERLLAEAVQLSGERTYSATVDRALFDFVQRMKARRIIELAGSGLWRGDLSKMRDDHPRARKSRKPRVSR